MDLNSLLSAFKHSDNILLFMWQNSPGWPVAYVSGNVEKVLGYKEHQFLQQEVNFEQLIHKSDLTRVNSELTMYSSIKTVEHFTHQDYRLVCKNGDVKWFSDATTIERNEQGEIEYYTGYLIDVTDRIAAENILLESRNQLELVIEGTRLGMWDWNPQTNAVEFNERWAQMLGLDANEIEHKLDTWSSRVHPDDMAGCEQKIQAHMNGETDFYQSIHRMKHVEGHWVYILDRGRIVEWDKNGDPIRFTGTHTDITEQKHNEMKARAAADAKSTFLANMSHEVRTPLHGVLGLLTLMKQTTLDDQQAEYVGIMQQTGEYLLQVLNDVLDMAKMEQGKLSVNLQPINVKECINHAYRLFSEKAQEKDIIYEVNFTENLQDWLKVDSARLTQIVTNLTSNAIKFTEKGKVAINVSTNPLSKDKTQLTVAVQDTGVGIKNIKKVLQEFEQEENELSEAAGGTGLGLAISQQLAGLLNGKIEITSEFGKGSCFALVCELDKAQPPQAENEAVIEYNKDVSILLVEDNITNMMIAEGMFGAIDLTFEPAVDGQEAVDKALANHYDIIFMDIHLPLKNGVEATKEIRAQKAGIPPVIIALTANAFDEDAKAYFEAGMQLHLSKPFSISDLERVIAQAQAMFVK